MSVQLKKDHWLFHQLAQPAFLLNLDKKIEGVNRAACSLLNIREQDVLGKSCSAVTGFAQCSGSCAFAEVVASGKGKKSLDLECLQSCGDNALCIELSPLHDDSGKVIGVLELCHDATIVRDLTNRLEQKQARLSTEIERTRTLVNSIADGIYTVDLNMQITRFSRSTERITGYREEDVLGRQCREIFNTSVCDTDCPLKWTMKNAKPVQNCSATLGRKDGSRLPAFLSSDLLRDANGEICGCVGIIRDRSEVEDLKAKMHKEFSFAEFVGKSKVMTTIFDRVRTVADSESTVLIEGESGTGKELLSRAIHYQSSRKGGPFVKVNCASLAETLLESELFGHDKGAFTGAVKDKPGRFELADGGTIFLDEIGDTSLALQSKLLRVLQEREFERVGGIKTRKTNVRVIAATNRDLKQMIATGEFREDLYYRLCVVPILLPALRERREDIPLLVESFLHKFNARGQRIKEVSSRAMAQLISYDWPGNVRELENAIEHAYVTSTTGRVERQFLPAPISQAEIIRLPETESSVHGISEKQKILFSLEKHRWKKHDVASDLGLSRTTLWRKMKQYGLAN